jgi:hypothetical protein
MKEPNTVRLQIAGNALDAKFTEIPLTRNPIKGKIGMKVPGNLSRAY